MQGWCNGNTSVSKTDVLGSKQASLRSTPCPHKGSLQTGHLISLIRVGSIPTASAKNGGWKKTASQTCME